MKCKQIHKKLIFYIENDLDVNETSEVKAHLQECPNCEYLYNQMAQSLKIINEDKLSETNPFFVTRVLEGVKNQPNRNSIFEWITQKQFALQASIYMVLIFLALLTGRFLGSSYANDQASIISETDTTDYQLFADSYNFQFNQNVYIIEVANNEE